MQLTLRVIKGSKLTFQELDSNFVYHDSLITAECQRTLLLGERKTNKADLITAINITYDDLQPDKITYINAAINIVSFNLNFRGIGLLKEGIHYAILKGSDKGFELINGLVFRVHDLIVLTPVFAYLRGNEYGNLVTDIDAQMPLSQNNIVSGCSCCFSTISQIRALTGTLKSTQFYTTDIGQEGNWYYDPTDTISIDNTGTILVTADDKRIKRIIDDSVNISWFGAKSDGDETNFTGTDNRDFIIKAIDYASINNKTIIINGKYFHSPLIITESNFNITMCVGTILICPLIGIQDKQITFNGGANNIVLNAYGAKCISPKTFTSGEWRHIINITNAQNINIFGLKCEGGGGDGFYIGNDIEGLLPKNIFIHDVIVYNIYRNGISIINGETIHLYNPLCQNIIGISPQYGIDIEPNANIFEILKDIRIVNPTTKNCASAGIGMVIGNYVNFKAKTADISIINHISIDDSIGFSITGKGAANPWDFKLDGSFKYNGSIFNPKANGININSWDADKAPVIDIEAYIENPYSGDDSNIFRINGITLFAGGGSAFDIGNFNIKATIRDTRPVPKTQCDVYFANSLHKIINYNIEIDSDFRRTSNRYILNSSTQNMDGLIKYKNKPIYNVDDPVNAIDTIKGVGGIFNCSDALDINLPSYLTHKKNVYQVNANMGFGVNIIPVVGEPILIDGCKVQKLRLNKVGQFIELEATDIGWKILSNNFERSSSTTLRPIVTEGNLEWFDTTLGKPIWFKSTGVWVDATGTAV